MNVTFQKTDDLNAIVIIEIQKEDYTDLVSKKLKQLQKQAVVKGFRPGKAPMGMIQSQYGKSVLADEINNLASEKLNDYIQEEKLELLGYPLSSDVVESKLDIDKDTEFSFAFDLAFAPKVELNYSNADTLTSFTIEVDEVEVNKDINYAREKAGDMQTVEIAEDNDIVYATVNELNADGTPLMGGVQITPISFVPNMITDETTKSLFIGVAANAVLKANVKEIFNNNESVIANSLSIAKEAIIDLNTDFEVTITDIKRRSLADLNEEYYKKVFGETDFPTNETEYRQRVKSNLENYYANESDMWLDHQIGDLLISKHEIQLPDAFLKRWLLVTKEKEYTIETIDEKYNAEKETLKRRLIIDKITTEEKVEASKDEIEDEAIAYTITMYRQYGYNFTADESFIKETIGKRLAEKEFVEQMIDRVTYKKCYDIIKEKITIKKESITIDNYFKLVNEHKH